MRSQRLTYRTIEAGDAGRVAALASDWDEARMTSRIPYPYSLLDADLWIASIATDEFVRGIEYDGNLIGAVGFVEDERRQAEMGYWIGKPSWGNGFATEAAHALMDYCFSECGIRRLMCGHFIDNAASADVIAKLGFRRIGNGTQWCEARKSEVKTIRYARRRPIRATWWRSTQ